MNNARYDKTSRACRRPARLLPAVLLLVSAASSPAQSAQDAAPSSSEPPAVLFRFQHAPGDQSRILSTVDEEVFVNGRLSHRAEILNRIFCTVSDVDSSGTASLEATFMTSEHSTGVHGGFSWGEEYRSAFRRTATGQYEIDSSCFMPTVRNVPVFPETPLKPGGTWTAEGHEAHDMRRTFGIEEPFIVPFVASYRYVGDEADAESGRTFNVVEVSYSMNFQSPAAPDAARMEFRSLPAYTMGVSEQTIWWDNERGMIDHYREQFRIIIETAGGDVIKFQGTARAEVTEWERFRTDENRRRLTQSVEELGLKDVAVTETDRGLTIS
ncbi:MAG: OmpA family protein, partial [Treponemataceae bacterium]|nr:OmpA family protein [Treponemataceae bacterium]